MAQGQRLLQTGTRLVAYGAHPDDLEYYVGGSLYRYAHRGGQVTAVIATSGELGGVAATRRTEQYAAARILEYDQVIFWDFPDRGLRTAAALGTRVAEILDQLQPDVVVMFDAEQPRLPYIHPDHQAVGRTVMTICKRLPRSPAVYLFLTRHPTAVVDVSAVWPMKRRTLQTYRSQHSGQQLPGFVRPLWRWSGRQTGFPVPPRMVSARRKRPSVREEIANLTTTPSGQESPPEDGIPNRGGQHCPM